MNSIRNSWTIGEEAAARKPVLEAFGSASMRSPVREAWEGADWPCSICGLIGCQHDDDLPAYRGAFDTEGRI